MLGIKPTRCSDPGFLPTHFAGLCVFMTHMYMEVGFRVDAGGLILAPSQPWWFSRV